MASSVPEVVVDADSIPAVAARAVSEPSADLLLTRTPLGALSLAELREVKVQLVAHFVSGELTVEWVDPAGAVYDRNLVTLETAERRELNFQLPVAGTLMQTSALTGTWQVRVLHGERTLASSTFEVMP